MKARDRLPVAAYAISLHPGNRPPTPTVAELVRRAAETADPAGRRSLGRTTAGHSKTTRAVTRAREPRGASRGNSEGADYDVEDQVWPSRRAVVLYLAGKGGQPDYDRDPNELIRSQSGISGIATPNYVADWLAAR